MSGLEFQDDPGGKVRARYTWNPVVVGEGSNPEDALEDLRRSHLLIGNTADGRWAGNRVGAPEMAETNAARPKAAKPKAAPQGQPEPDPAVTTPAAVKAAPKPKPKPKKPGAPPKAATTRDGMKKAGDGLPVDLAGSLLGEGSIVAVPMLTPPAEGETVPNVRLRLGYIRKLGKSFIDVIVYVTDKETEEFRCTDPRNELIEVNPELLNSRVPLYEAVKLGAATNRGY